MSSKLVVHFKDGQVAKGHSSDLFPNKTVFHFTDSETQQQREIALEDLKGVFFVKDFEGRTDRERRYDQERVGFGRRIEVTFSDGETITGYTSGYSRDRPAFFVFPADPEDNTERVLVVNAATTSVNLA